MLTGKRWHREENRQKSSVYLQEAFPPPAYSYVKTVFYIEEEKLFSQQNIILNDGSRFEQKLIQDLCLMMKFLHERQHIRGL